MKIAFVFVVGIFVVGMLEKKGILTAWEWIFIGLMILFVVVLTYKWTTEKEEGEKRDAMRRHVNRRY